MAGVKKTWREKRLAKEENGTYSDDSWDSYYLEGGDVIQTGNEGQMNMEALDVNMVFVILAEFQVPYASEVVELSVEENGLCSRGQSSPTNIWSHFTLKDT
jgi:hypothetical protein